MSIPLDPALIGALLPAAFLGPLAMAAALASPMAGAVLRALPLAAVPALAAVALLPVPAAVGGPWLLMGAGLGLEAMARVYLGFTAVLWAVAAWAAAGWLRGAAHPVRFAACFLLAMAGNFGLILATDAPGFYSFFALMSFASYGLVVHAGTTGARAAGRLYIGFVVAGELALFAGLALAAHQAGTLELTGIGAGFRSGAVSDPAAWLLIAGLGAKLGVMPLHVWLPPAHGAAPAPASAVLSGAMIKAGLWGMMAVLPLGGAALPDHGTVLLAAGLVTLFAAVLAGLREGNPKAVLGWSSVAQMGLMALGLGAALKAPAAWGAVAPVLVGLAAHHALAKGALFLGAGAVAAQRSARGRAVLLVALAVPALGLAGAAGTAGAGGKEALKTALAAGPAGWAPWLGMAITLAGLGTTLLMARFGWTLWHGTTAGDPAGRRGRGGAGTAPGGAVAGPAEISMPGGTMPFAVLATLALALPVLWPLAAPELAAGLTSGGTPAAWPLAAGLVLALAAMAAHHAHSVGPARLWRRVSAPARQGGASARAAALRLRRAVRVQARRLPARAIAGAGAARLAPAAPAAALAVVLAVIVMESGASPFSRDFATGNARPAPPPADAPPPLDALPTDPHAPGTGLLQTLPPILFDPPPAL